MSKDTKNNQEENVEQDQNSSGNENPDEIKIENVSAKDSSEDEITASYEKKISELSEQVKELNDRLLRKAAEFENYKRRTENDQLNLLNYAAEGFIIKLLPVIDDFERSLSHIKDAEDISAIKNGIKLVYDKFIKILKEAGVQKMESVGKPFNVDQHDALMQQKDESVPPHTVLQQVENGYIYKDKVIRHAKVIVSEESSQESPEEQNKKTNSSNE
jgi:molecular chaperone GrpE